MVKLKCKHKSKICGGQRMVVFLANKLRQRAYMKWRKYTIVTAALSATPSNYNRVSSLE